MRKFVALTLVLLCGCGGPGAPLHVAVDRAELRANGYDAATLTADAQPTVTVLEAHSAGVEEVVARNGKWQARIRAGVTPGRIHVRVESPGRLPASVEITS